MAGISRPDFIAKMAVASKEARETHYWLRLLRDSKIVPAERIAPLSDELGPAPTMRINAGPPGRVAPVRRKAHRPAAVEKGPKPMALSI